jgi:hypothetical protein
MVLSPVVRIERSIQKTEKAISHYISQIVMQEKKIDEMMMLLNNSRSLLETAKRQLDFYKRELEVIEH